MKYKLSIFFFSFSVFVYSQCWKTNTTGQNFSHGIKEDGTLWSWGYGYSQNLGNGLNIDSNIPIQIGNLNNWDKISSWQYHTMAIKTDGTLWGWGWNIVGQLGDNTLIDKIIPTQIGNSNDWAKIECGQAFTVAIKNNGTLWAWGGNQYGQLGNGNFENQINPIQIGIDNDWKEIICGQGHVLALKENGALWAWGRNDFGQLGIGNFNSDINIPTLVSNEVWKSIATNSLASFAIKLDNSLWSWGQRNNFGFYNISLNQNIPLLIDNQSEWKSISAISNPILALKTDNTLWAWGCNIYGVLGNNTSSDSIITIPIQIGNSNNWKKIRADQFHYFAEDNQGNLFSWGANAHGQLGINTNVDTFIPTMISCPSSLNTATFEYSNIMIYPNPTSNFLIIKNDKFSIFKIELLNIQGELIILKESNEDKIILNLSDLENSIYFLKLHSVNDDKIFFKKIIKID